MVHVVVSRVCTLSCPSVAATLGNVTKQAVVLTEPVNKEAED